MYQTKITCIYPSDGPGTYHGNPVRSWYASSDEITARIGKINSSPLSPAPVMSSIMLLSCTFEGSEPNSELPVGSEPNRPISESSRSGDEIEKAREWKAPRKAGELTRVGE